MKSREEFEKENKELKTALLVLCKQIKQFAYNIGLRTFEED